MLDHNNHLNRDKARNKQLMYAQKILKSNKKWYVTPTFQEIENMRTSSPHVTVKQKRPIPFDHPARLQPTIGNTIPNNILEIEVPFQ